METGTGPGAGTGAGTGDAGGWVPHTDNTLDPSHRLLCLGRHRGVRALGPRVDRGRSLLDRPYSLLLSRGQGLVREFFV